MKKIYTGNIAKIVIIAILFGSPWTVMDGLLRNPHEALNDLYEAKGRAEDQLIDPLVLAGEDVVPLILNELPNKKIKLRRYAIGFLGNGKYAQALPRLEAIVRDESEMYYFHADPLSAIYQISPGLAKNY